MSSGRRRGGGTSATSARSGGEDLLWRYVAESETSTENDVALRFVCRRLSNAGNEARGTVETLLRKDGDAERLIDAIWFASLQIEFGSGTDEDEDDPRGTIKFPYECRVILESLQRVYPRFVSLNSLFSVGCGDETRRKYMVELTEDVVTTLLEVITRLQSHTSPSTTAPLSTIHNHTGGSVGVQVR